MKELINEFNSFINKWGFDINRVFDDFLSYIIWLHTLPEYGHSIKGWKYTREQSKTFFDLYKILISVFQKELKHKQWFDPFGDIYEEVIASRGRRNNNGQFFTPYNLCELMAEITYAPQIKEGKRCLVSDPTCGSGRTLLAFHVRHLGNYLVAEDIDRTCCLMTVCNFILHGVEGEVIWHNSLEPDSFFGAWKTNEFLNHVSKYNGLPHCREISFEDSTLKRINDKSKQVQRIRMRLEEQKKALLSRLKYISLISSKTEEDRALARELTRKINNIKKILRKYE